MFRLVLVLLLVITGTAAAQRTVQYAVPLTPTVIEGDTLSIRLSWPVDSTTQSLKLYRRELGPDNWGAPVVLDSLAAFYVDRDIARGVAYEYRIEKDFVAASQQEKVFGYAVSGFDIETSALRGTVLLIVDNTKAEPLAKELARLSDDLRLDGWYVIRNDVSPIENPAVVKEWIATRYRADPKNVRSVFLFGRIPVPYSGNFNPDAHPDHKGAWPADVYYADMHGEWIDGDVTNQAAERPENRNVPGDGKFIHNRTPGEVTLELGRVDLSFMPAFKLSETELLRQYLEKDHRFRHGRLTAPSRALIDDKFGPFGGEAFATSAWRNFSALVGYGRIEERAWFKTLDTAEYLWAYACGPGSYQGAQGVGQTEDFADRDSKAIFTLLFGSYFGDWDVENSFLRAPLATSYGLTSGWAGRPHWHLYSMAVGETIGYGAKLTQNNTGLYVTSVGYNSIHVALMGDPTLRMEYSVPRPRHLTLSKTRRGGVELKWKTAGVGVEGYHVYRSTSTEGPFVQLTEQPVVGHSYIDRLPLPDSNVYQVRAVATRGGTIAQYRSASLAIEGVIAGVVPSIAAAPAKPEDLMKVSSRRNDLLVNLKLKQASPVRLSLCDVTGRELKVVDEGSLDAGSYSYRFPGEMESSGAYLVRLVAGPEVESDKVLITQ